MAGVRGPGGKFLSKKQLEEIVGWEAPVQVVEQITPEEMKYRAEDLMLNNPDIYQQPTKEIKPMATAGTRFIGEVLDNVAFPEGRASSAGKSVWKETLEVLKVGQARLVTGVKKATIEQVVYKTKRKHFEDRKFKVWKVSLEGGGEGYMVGRVE